MMTDSLFASFALGPLSLSNRIVMAPLTRSRSLQPGNVPTRLNAYYYGQRAGAGLIISEATQISPQGQGYAWTPGIHAPEQLAGWRFVTDAVHRAGGLIFMQLWHVGRVSHPALQPDGLLPVAPSAIAPEGMAFVTDERGEPSFAPFVTPRALETDEIPAIVEQYREAARNASQAGFDGIEIHAANGYLLDQFLNSSTNRRTDHYGGSCENRARLLFEVLEAACAVWGPGRVGVRLSPLGTFNSMGDDDPVALFAFVAEALNELKLAYLHVVEPIVAGNAIREQPDPRGPAIMALIRQRYRGPLIVCGGYDGPRAATALDAGRADLVAFGRSFLANPDLPERLRVGASLNLPDPATFYGGGWQGYIDYPTLAQIRGDEPIPDYAAVAAELLSSG